MNWSSHGWWIFWCWRRMRKHCRVCNWSCSTLCPSPQQLFSTLATVLPFWHWVWVWSRKLCFNSALFPSIRQWKLIYSLLFNKLLSHMVSTHFQQCTQFTRLVMRYNPSQTINAVLEKLYGYCKMNWHMPRSFIVHWWILTPTHILSWSTLHRVRSATFFSICDFVRRRKTCGDRRDANGQFRNDAAAPLW